MGFPGTAIIAGLGNSTGTGAATARLFASKGFRVALISRTPSELQKFAEELTSAGGVAAAFPVTQYTVPEITSAFAAIEAKWPSVVGQSGVRFALWNAGSSTWGKLLEITPAQIQESVDVNIVGAFAFAQESVKAILNATGEVEKKEGNRGTIVFTGATAALRGGNGFAAFAAGKFGIRAIAQSAAREYGPEGIHIAHAIIDGGILTDRAATRYADKPELMAKYSDPRKVLLPESIAKSYWYLHEQDASAWTQELDLRPSHEKW
ncbi:hypothetical protein RQP46_006173 [Phenoliferia psychrophenolica]